MYNVNSVFLNSLAALQTLLTQNRFPWGLRFFLAMLGLNPGFKSGRQAFYDWQLTRASRGLPFLSVQELTARKTAQRNAKVKSIGRCYRTLDGEGLGNARKAWVFILVQVIFFLVTPPTLPLTLRNHFGVELGSLFLSMSTEVIVRGPTPSTQANNKSVETLGWLGPVSHQPSLSFLVRWGKNTTGDGQWPASEKWKLTAEDKDTRNGTLLADCWEQMAMKSPPGWITSPFLCTVVHCLTAELRPSPSELFMKNTFLYHSLYPDPAHSEFPL